MIPLLLSLIFFNNTPWDASVDGQFIRSGERRSIEAHSPITVVREEHAYGRFSSTFDIDLNHSTELEFFYFWFEPIPSFPQLGFGLR